MRLIALTTLLFMLSVLGACKNSESNASPGYDTFHRELPKLD